MQEEARGYHHIPCQRCKISQSVQIGGSRLVEVETYRVRVDNDFALCHCERRKDVHR